MTRFLGNPILSISLFPPRRVVLFLLLSMLTLAVSGAVIDRTIARLNGDILTESDLAEVTADAAGQFRSHGGDAFALATSETVVSMLDRSLLLQEARRLKISPTTDEMNLQVEGMVQEIRAKFLSEKEFHEALASERISLDQLKQELIKKSKTDFLVYHVINSRYSVSDQDVENYTAQAQAEGAPLSSYRLRRLGIAITKKLGNQGALAKARSVVTRIINDGISFEEGVRKYSEVPGAEADAGDLGYMSADKLNSQVRLAVENLEPGQASNPLIAGGYANIFYLEGKRGAKSAVREKKFFEAREELLVQLRRKAILQVFDNRLMLLLPPEYNKTLSGASSSSPAPSVVNNPQNSPQSPSSNILSAATPTASAENSHNNAMPAPSPTPDSTPQPRRFPKLFGR